MKLAQEARMLGINVELVTGQKKEFTKEEEEIKK